MKRRTAKTARQKQINILHTETRKRHSRKQLNSAAVWTAIILVMTVVVGVAVHVGINALLAHALYDNPRYALEKIEIEPSGRFAPYVILRAANLERGENLWSLNLARIAHDLEELPSVSSAKVERHFPDRLVIHLVERVPVVKIVGINDIGKRETLYLDRQCIVLKPREDEPTPLLPEIIGLTNAELEPGVRLDQPALAHALEILDAIKHDSVLNTSIDIRSIDLSQPLCIKMVTTRDTSITFRPDYIDQQLLRLQAIFESFGNGERTLHTVDLTPDQFDPITFYE